jgi:hypothetical protein
MQFFGLFGLGSIGVGGLVGLYLVVRKIIAGLVGGMDAFRAFRIGTSPWLFFTILLIVVGVQFFLMGLLGEMITRTYHESQAKAIYAIRAIVEHDAVEHDAVEHDAVEHDAVEHDDVEHDDVEHDDVEHDVVPAGAASTQKSVETSNV